MNKYYNSTASGTYINMGSGRDKVFGLDLFSKTKFYSGHNRYSKN